MDAEIDKRLMAWGPVGMSVATLVLVAFKCATAGVRPDVDEGALAHLWQLLMLAQIALIARFAYRSLRRAPRQALTVLMLQLAALAVALLPVWILGW